MNINTYKTRFCRYMYTLMALLVSSFVFSQTYLTYQATAVTPNNGLDGGTITVTYTAVASTLYTNGVLNNPAGAVIGDFPASFQVAYNYSDIFPTDAYNSPRPNLSFSGFIVSAPVSTNFSFPTSATTTSTLFMSAYDVRLNETRITTSSQLAKNTEFTWPSSGTNLGTAFNNEFDPTISGDAVPAYIAATAWNSSNIATAPAGANFVATEYYTFSRDLSSVAASFPSGVSFHPSYTRYRISVAGFSNNGGIGAFFIPRGNDGTSSSLIDITTPNPTSNVLTGAIGMQSGTTSTGTMSAGWRLTTQPITLQKELCTAPTITSQPAVSTSYCQNATATPLSVTATGATAYQWYSNTTNSNTGGTLISGATSSTYTPSTATIGTFYYYVVTSSGSCTTTSTTSAVIVNTVLSSQPTGATYCQNTAATALSVTAAGATYQWYSNTSNSNTGGTLISGATSSTYTPSTATAGTIYYYVIANNGTCSESSNAVAIVVNALPTITASGSTGLSAGDTLQLTGSGTAATSNAWVSSNTAVATVSNTGLVTAVANGSSTITYTNSVGCSATITIGVGCQGFGTDGGSTVCVGSYLQLSGFRQGNHVFGGTESTNFGQLDLSTSTRWTTDDTLGNIGYWSAIGTASYTGASDANNINGYIKHYANAVNQGFTFPVGMGNDLRSVTISGIRSADSQIAVNWIPGDPSVEVDPTNNNEMHSVTSLGTGIAQVSKWGQWDWVNIAGTFTGTITVSIPSMQYFSSASNLRLVGWNGTQWVNLGTAGASANTENATLSGTMIAGIQAIAIGTILKSNNGIDPDSLTAVQASVGSWSSSNTAVATVSANGLVTPVAAGTVTITYTENGCTVDKVITVVNCCPTLTATTNTICVGDNLTITPSIAGGAWSVDAGLVASVDDNGIVTSNRPGTVIVSYRINGCTTNYSITVKGVFISGNTTACPGSVSNFTAYTPSTFNGIPDLSTPATGGTWSVISGNATISSTIANPTSLTKTGSGPIELGYTLAGCTSKFSVFDPYLTLVSDSVDPVPDGPLSTTTGAIPFKIPVFDDGDPGSALNSNISGNPTTALGVTVSFSNPITYTGANNVNPPLLLGGDTNAANNILIPKSIYSNYNDLNYYRASDSYFSPTTALVEKGFSNYVSFYNLYLNYTRINGQAFTGTNNGYNTAKYKVGTMTVTFSRSVKNPILHFMGIGAGLSVNISQTEFVLKSSGINISKLSGTATLKADNTQKRIYREITNNVVNAAVNDIISTARGGYAGTGSILFDTAGSSVTELVFDVYAEYIDIASNGIQSGNTATYLDAIALGVTVDAASEECSTGACYKPAATGGMVLDTKQGITALGRAGANNGNWPMARKGAWTALESKTKGFVINRVPTTAALANITGAVEGMMVYDEEADCLKVYTTKEGETTAAWHCMNTQACPD